MSAAVALQEQQTEVYSQLQVADGYTRAVRRQAQLRRAPLRALLLDLRRMLNRVLRSFDSTSPSLRSFLEENQDKSSDRELQSLLWRLRDNVEGLRTIIAHRQSLVQARSMVVAYWTKEIQDRLLAHLEEYEDVTDALALGLNAAFRQEIADCRMEAGISDVVASA